MSCPACGADNERHARFCGQCGAPLTDESVDLGHVGIVSPRAVWSTIVAIALGLFALGALASWLLQPEPEFAGPAPIHAAVLVEVEALPEGVDIPDVALESSDPPAPSAPATAEPRGLEPAAPSVPAAPPSRPRARPSPAPPPAAELPPPYVEEPLEEPPPTADPALYMAGARRHLASTYGDRVQDCFDQGDSRRPGYSGRIGVAFVLFPDGRVASSRVTQNTTGDPLIGTCLTESARAWQLPPPPRRTLELSMSFSR